MKSNLIAILLFALIGNILTLMNCYEDRQIVESDYFRTITIDLSGQVVDDYQSISIPGLMVDIWELDNLYSQSRPLTQYHAVTDSTGNFSYQNLILEIEKFEYYIVVSDPAGPYKTNYDNLIVASQDGEQVTGMTIRMQYRAN